MQQGSGAHVLGSLFRSSREIGASCVLGVVGWIGPEERHGLHHHARARGHVLVVCEYDASLLHVGDYPLGYGFGAAIDFGGIAAVGVDAGPDKEDEVEEAGGFLLAFGAMTDVCARDESDWG